MSYKENATAEPRMYYYVTNLQGDILSMVDADGFSVAEYYYNAYGLPMGSSGEMADINPLRYRGYYFDNETGLYYLKSRYYDPAVCRFINADATIGQVGNVQSTNMFAYCLNNPVKLSDHAGNWPKLSTIFTVIAVAAVVVAAVAITVATCGAAAPALAAAGGAVIGGISAGAASTAAGVAVGAIAVASASVALTATSIAAEKIKENLTDRNNSVYVLKDSSGTVQYVGRTNNVEKRRSAHKANPYRTEFELEVIASGLSKPQSRALEQAGMVYYHTINTANKANNQINGIAPKYWGAFKEIALGFLDYGWNQMTNEILYWTGN